MPFPVPEGLGRFDFGLDQMRNLQMQRDYIQLQREQMAQSQRRTREQDIQDERERQEKKNQAYLDFSNSFTENAKTREGLIPTKKYDPIAFAKAMESGVTPTIEYDDLGRKKVKYGSYLELAEDDQAFEARQHREYMEGLDREKARKALYDQPKADPFEYQSQETAILNLIKDLSDDKKPISSTELQMLMATAAIFGGSEQKAAMEMIQKWVASGGIPQADETTEEGKEVTGDRKVIMGQAEAIRTQLEKVRTTRLKALDTTTPPHLGVQIPQAQTFGFEGVPGEEMGPPVPGAFAPVHFGTQGDAITPPNNDTELEEAQWKLRAYAKEFGKENARVLYDRIRYYWNRYHPDNPIQGTEQWQYPAWLR